MTNAIHIVNASHISDADVRTISDAITKIFPHRVIVERVSLDLEQAFDNARGQYSSGNLLSQILATAKEDHEKRIVIVDVDLFIPVLTFIFGEAQFEGSVAIVSTYRLSNEFYGLATDHQKLLLRLEKEIIHELGHIFGLYHCHQFECVMRSSTYVEEIDLKQISLCPVCQHQVLTKISSAV